MGLHRRWGCYHPWLRKVLDEAICASPSPSHDIRPPCSFCPFFQSGSVSHKVNVCMGKHNSMHWPRVEQSIPVLQNLSPGLSFQLLEFSLPTRSAWRFLIHSTCISPCPLWNGEKWRVWLWVSSTSGVCGQLWWWRVGLVGLGLAP